MTWIVIEIGNKMKLKMRIILINSRTRTWCSRWLAFSKAHVALCHHQSIDSIIFVLIGRMLHTHQPPHTRAHLLSLLFVSNASFVMFNYLAIPDRNNFPIWCLLLLLLLFPFSFSFNQYFNLKFDYATTTMCCLMLSNTRIVNFFRSFQNERKTLYKKKQMV